MCIAHVPPKDSFLSDPGIPGVQSRGPGLCHWLTHWCLVDLTDVSLVDDDANLILADETNRAIPDNFDQISQSWPISEFQPNFSILTKFQNLIKFQNLNQISESRPNFRILIKFQNLDQISEFWNLYQISGFWPNFWILTEFLDFDQI